MTNYSERAGLQVADVLVEFIETRALAGTGIDASRLWSGLADILTRFVPRNRALLATRDVLQAQLDDWHRAHPGPVTDMAAYQAFLRESGYLILAGHGGAPPRSAARPARPRPWP